MATPTTPGFTRANVYRELPEAYRAMSRLEAAIGAAGLDPLLLELVRTRVSQLNGCAFCLDMHQRDARAAGEHQQRLDVLAAWREAPFFDVRERAALDLAEALTRVADRPFAHETWSEASRHFEPRALAALVFAVTAINGWNRLSIAAGMTPAPQEANT